MAEAAAEIGGAAHLPEQPGQALGPGAVVLGQEVAELLGQVDEDRARFEDAGGGLRAVVDERGDLGVRIRRDEAARELVAVADVDQVSVVLGVMPAVQELLEHHRDLHPVRRRQRVDLERMFAHRQVLLVGRTGDRPVDLGEAAAALGVPLPDLGRGVGGVVHGINPGPQRGGNGAPWRSRTPNLRIRSPTLYPVELRVHFKAAAPSECGTLAAWVGEVERQSGAGLRPARTAGRLRRQRVRTLVARSAPPANQSQRPSSGGGMADPRT